MIDTTICLAIENAIKGAVASQRKVFIVKPSKQAHATLERLGLFELIPGTQLCTTRTEALQRAVG